MSKYPLFIFGAGASFDSIDSHERFSSSKQYDLDKWKPPLTDKIFDRTRFDEILNLYEDAKEIDAMTHKITKGHSLEDLVTEVLDKLAPKNPNLYRALMSFKFYLQHLFREITKEYYDHTNNYKKLLVELERNGIDETCIINFNYDLLLEKNIPSIANAKKVDAYISGTKKVIKIHGAYNWFRGVGLGDRSDSDFKGGKGYAMANSKHILDSEANTGGTNGINTKPIIKDQVQNWDFFEPSYGDVSDKVLYFVPDLALPVHKKRDFVCPQEHIKILEGEFQKIDRIIIIGWKAADQFLLDVLKKHVGNRPIIVVSPSSSETISNKIIKHCGVDQSRVISMKKTFTEFVGGDYLEKILSAENMDVLIQSNWLNVL